MRKKLRWRRDRDFRANGRERHNLPTRTPAAKKIRRVRRGSRQAVCRDATGSAKPAVEYIADSEKKIVRRRYMYPQAELDIGKLKANLEAVSVITKDREKADFG